uniref:Low-density lipoprotein receptor-related protein 4-like n=1 Tax=Crassostrea virginica TaxID=6565 RepID=A0A8B8DE82_CRAVI|nr:low-density lipoprotein receptor-related protein 4-like [Crassostrea virginica]
MMIFLRVTLVIGCIISSEKICLGSQSEKGLVIGLWNPAEFLTYTGVPEDSTSSFQNRHYPLQSSSAQIISLASDPKKATVFASIGKSIYMYRNFSIWQNRSSSILLLYKGISLTYGKIAFDYVSNNIYWCDRQLKWIAMKPAYNLNNSIYKVIIRKDLNYPEGLALDPVNRLMFFSDNGPNPRIERAFLDGQDREVIVFVGLVRVISLSVDVLNKKLYWIDDQKDTLECSNYDGSSRRVIRLVVHYPFRDLIYFQNILHVVSSTKKKLVGFDVASGSWLYTKTFTNQTPYAITVYNAETVGTHNDPCSTMACGHLCVNAKSGPRCLCAEGFQLAADGKNCTDKSQFYEKGFIVHNLSTIAMHEVSSINGQEGEQFLMKMSSFMIGGLAVDANADKIYFIDSKSDSIKELNMMTGQVGTLTHVSSGSADLILDWMSSLLGWIEAQTNIMTFSVNSDTTNTIYTNLQHVNLLTIDSHNGVLFWVSGTSGSRSLFRGTWTRETPQIIVPVGSLDNPVSLQYDITNNRIYWLDRSHVKSAMTNGSDIKSHILAVGASMAFVYKGFYGWIKGDQIHFTRQTSTKSENVVDTVQNTISVAFFDASLQQDRRGTCQVLNGGCEEICIPVAYGRRCECDIGLQLQDDFTCDSNVLMMGFIVVADYSHDRILQISLQTGSLLKLPITGHSPTGIVFDRSTKTLFYSEIESKTIMSTSLHGKGTTLFYRIGLAFASELAIDYSTGNLYYTGVASETFRNSGNYIGSVHRNASLHKTLLSTPQKPRVICLYPSKGFLFWSEWGTVSAIRRAYMDGTSSIYIATRDIRWPNGLAIDFTSNILYWVDGTTNRVEFSNLDGGNRQVLTTITDAVLYNIGIHGQYIYYAGWKRPGITKIDKTTGSIVPFMSHHPELGRLDGMDIYADDTIDVSPICSINNGHCSTFCFPTPSGRTCGCQDNVRLQSDQLTCQGVTLCPSSLENAVLSPDCLRRSGDSCSFSCPKGYTPSTTDELFCTTEGVWNNDTTTLCSMTLCPSSLENAVLSPDCLRRSGDSCSFSCPKGYTPSTTDELLCTTEGVWNNDTTTLCSKITPKQKNEANAESKTSLYVGGAVGGLLVVIIVVVAIIFLLKRRNSGRETEGGCERPLSIVFSLYGVGPKPEDDYCKISY